MRPLAVWTLLLALAVALPALPPTARAEPPDVSRLAAVLDISLGEGVPAALQRPFTNRLINELLRIGKYDFIDRANRDQILTEQSFQCSDAVAEECRVEAGRLLGVSKLVTGEITHFGESWFLSVQMVDVATGQLLAGADASCECKPSELPEQAAVLARRLMGIAEAAPPSAPAAPAAPTAATVAAPPDPDAPLAFGVVDLQRALLERAEGKAARQALQTTFTQMQARLNAGQEELHKLKREAEAASGEQRAQLLARFEREQAALQEIYTRSQAALTEAEAHSVSALRTGLRGLLSPLRAQGYAVVLDSPLWAAPGVDVTAHLLALGSASPVAAPAARPARRTGCLDLERVFTQSAEGRLAQEDLRKLTAERQRELDAERAAVEKATRELEKMRPVFSPAALAKRTAEVEAQRARLQQRFEELQKELARRQAAAQEKLRALIDAQLPKLAKIAGADLILDRRVLAHAPPACALDAALIALLDSSALPTAGGLPPLRKLGVLRAEALLAALGEGSNAEHSRRVERAAATVAARRGLDFILDADAVVLGDPVDLTDELQAALPARP